MTVSEKYKELVKGITGVLLIVFLLLYISSGTSYSESKSRTVYFGDSILLNFTTVNATNFNTTDGSILLKVSGGVPPYRVNYMPLTADTTKLFMGDSIMFNNLPMGGYLFFVDDSSGSRSFNSVIIDKK